MSIDPAVESAADTYVGQPFNLGAYSHLIRMAERDAFIAVVAWRDGHQETHQ